MTVIQAIDWRFLARFTASAQFFSAKADRSANFMCTSPSAKLYRWTPSNKRACAAQNERPRVERHLLHYPPIGEYDRLPVHLEERATCAVMFQDVHQVAD